MPGPDLRPVPDSHILPNRKAVCETSYGIEAGPAIGLHP